MKALILACTLFFSPICFATTPVALATGKGPSYSTQMQAVRAALNASSVHYRSEYGGIIYELNHRYYYTRPVTLEESSEVRFKVEIVRTAHLVALYHTHPPGALSSLFSECDIEIADQLHVPSYILVLDKGQIKSFVPGVTKTFEQGGGVLTPRVTASYGKVVGRISTFAKVGTYLN